MPSPARLPHTIALVSTAPAVWGAERSLLALGAGLEGSGYATSLITSNEELAAMWRDSVGTGIKQVPRSHGGLRLAHALRTAMKETGADATVCFSARAVPAFVLEAMRPRRRRSQLVIDLHDHFPTRWGRLKMRVATRFFDATVANSLFTLKQYARGARSTVLYRPFPHVDQRPPLRNRGSEIHVGVVGRIDPDKHLELAIAIACKDPGLRVIVIGDALAANSAYASRIRALGEPKGVIFRGRVDPAEAYRGVDVLLVCNPTEPMGRTVWEALAQGVAPVVPDSGGPRELLPPGWPGIYRAGDASDALSAIKSVAHNGALVSEATTHARGFALTSAEYAEKYASFVLAES